MIERALVTVLAAGSASRFGGGKLDADLGGRPVGARVLDAVAAAGLPPGVIVVPQAVPAFAAEAAGWSLLENPHAADGLGSSVAVAAHAALRRGAGHLLVLLADMPLLDPGHVRRLLASEAPAATRYPGDVPGVPVLLSASLFPALAQLTGDRGAGAVLRGRADVTLIDPPADMLADVDRAEDLARIAALLGG